jgi:hypothetical protein
VQTSVPIMWHPRPQPVKNLFSFTIISYENGSVYGKD